MASRHAVTLFARLASHYPSLGGNDTAAEARALDWCNIIDRARPDVADQAIAELVECWAYQRPPRIGDFQETCRNIARQRAIPPASALAIDAPKIAEDRMRAILDRARAAVTGPATSELRHPLIPHERTTMPSSGGTVATFDELYGDAARELVPDRERPADD